MPNEDLLVKPRCESCGNEDSVYKDIVRGEIVCLDCGNVMESHTIDARGIRIYDVEDFENKLHYEPFNPRARPLIKITSGDAITARRRERENNRIEWKYKRVIVMRVELSKLKSRLPFSKEVEDRTMEEIEKVFNTGILRGRSAIPMTMALLYYSCIQCNSPIGLKDILESLYDGASDDIEMRKIRKAVRSSIRTLSRVMDYKFTIKNDYGMFLEKVSNELQIPQFACTTAIKIFKKLEERVVFSGDPIGYAGACLYHACKKHADEMPVKITQKDIASVVKMTEVTVRKRSKELKTLIDISTIIA